MAGSLLLFAAGVLLGLSVVLSVLKQARMAARYHLAAALGVACLALLVLFQLTTTFGLPQLDVWKAYGLPLGSGSSSQAPGEPGFADFEQTEIRDTGSQYLLGVGKADITG
jgi:hypothetical protein